MKTLKMASAILAGAFAAGAAFAEIEVSDEQFAMAKAAPRNMKLMIAGFGTIESITQVDKWLGEQLLPQQNLSKPPTLSDADKIKDPDIDRDIVRFNWNTRKMEYLKNVSEIDQENARNKRLLDNLRTKTLANDATRYIPLAKDYLQAALSRRAGSLVQVVDRSNVDMNLVEQAMNGDNSSVLAGAGCILTATLGDREEDSRTVPVNARVNVKKTTYTQPYTFKIRDLQGNVLVASSGTAEWAQTDNSVVASTSADPARKLIENVCDQIAEKVTEYFTATLKFKVKVPDDCDEDDAEVAVDGRDIDIESGIRVLAVEHVVSAELDGCKPIRRIVSIDNDTGKVLVKLSFKKAKKVKKAKKAEVDDDEADEGDDDEA